MTLRLNYDHDKPVVFITEQTERIFHSHITKIYSVDYCFELKMDVFNILLYLTLLILGKIIYDKFKNHQFDKMFNKLPGPPKYPLIGTVLPLLEVQRKDRFKVLIKLFEEYKEIGFYRMIYGNFRDVRLFRCDYAEKILKSSKHIEKASTYKLYSAWLGNGE